MTRTKFRGKEVFKLENRDERAIERTVRILSELIDNLGIGGGEYEIVSKNPDTPGSDGIVNYVDDDSLYRAMRICNIISYSTLEDGFIRQFQIKSGFHIESEVE